MRLSSGFVWFRGRAVKKLFEVFGPFFHEFFRVRDRGSFICFQVFTKWLSRPGQLFHYAVDFPCISFLISRN